MKCGKRENSRVLPSVHFTLRASTESALEIIKELHTKTRNLGFIKVSPIAKLTEDECLVTRDDDEFKCLKIHARGFLVKNKKIISYVPKSIVGFQCLLHNGSILNIGLCEYPRCIDIDEECIRTGTKTGESQWMSYVNTVTQDQVNPKQCYKSHLSVLNLLHICDHMEILVHLKDPYEQWDSPDEREFRVKMIDKVALAH